MLVGYKFQRKQKIKPVSINKYVVLGRVARHWNVFPWDLREMTSEQKAELYAMYDVENEIEAYYAIENKRMADKDSAGVRERQKYGR